MPDFDSRHVGKDLFRAKEHIIIINELTNEEILVSLKAYGDGPLQLSTDKDSLMFPKLTKYGKYICDKATIFDIFSSDEFSSLDTINVMPLIYREDDKMCNIMVFDFELLRTKTSRIVYIGKGFKYDSDLKDVVPGKGRTHPIIIFFGQRRQLYL